MDLSQVEFLAVDVRGLRSASRRVSWGAGFSPFDSSRRELLVSVEKNFRLVLRLLTGKILQELEEETCSCLCCVRASDGGACTV